MNHFSERGARGGLILSVFPTPESPSFMSTAWLFGSHLHRRARRESDVEIMGGVPQSSLEFHPPELPDDTLMEVGTRINSHRQWKLRVVSAILGRNINDHIRLIFPHNPQAARPVSWPSKTLCLCRQPVL